MARLSPPSFRDALLTTAPWALALGFALGAHSGWFCPGHQHATHVDVVSADDGEIAVFRDDDDPCAREHAAERIRELAQRVHRVAETHTMPAELIAALADDPGLLADHGTAELVMRDGEPIGFRISNTVSGGLAQQLGLRDGDVITSVAGQPLRSVDDVAKAASAVRGFAQVRMMIARDGVAMRKRFLIR
jgi:membrane-associated protease RseP (regulator of RpoE activity)